MSYTTYVQIDGLGGVISSYHTPSDVVQPGVLGEGWVRLDKPLLMPRGRLGRVFLEDGKVRERSRVRLSLESRGRLKAGIDTAVILIEGAPPGRNVRLLIAGASLVEVQEGQSLSLTWNVPTNVSIRLDPTQVDLIGNHLEVSFV